MEKKRKYTILPVTRVEGHGKVTIHMNEANEVEQVRLHIVEFRGFERFILGRPYWEVPVIVQRLCGICPVSHHLAAAKAMDRIVGGENLTPTAEKMRRLMHYGQTFQSHALHFFHLSSPDFLFGTDGSASSAFGADVSKRHVLAVAAKYPELAVQGVMMRKFGQEVIKATAGKKIHGTGAIPGGINKNLTIAERDALRNDIDQMLAWSQGAITIARDFTIHHLAELVPFGSFDSNHLSLVRESDGAMDLYHGVIHAIDRGGNVVINKLDYQNYLSEINEEVRSWSSMKFPFIKKLGTDRGWYRVGPLARLNTCTFIDTPLAEAARQDFFNLTSSGGTSWRIELDLAPGTYEYKFLKGNDWNALNHDNRKLTVRGGKTILEINVPNTRSLAVAGSFTNWKPAGMSRSGYHPNNLTMCYHWARMIELLHSAEMIKELLFDNDLQGDDLVVTGKRREEAVGLIEAPRGTLFHHYRVDKNDAVTMCNLIVSTTNNNEPMNQAVTRVAKDHFSGKKEISEGLLNHIEVAIRAYDPCLSCATHSLGRMPLQVEVLDAAGEIIDSRQRD